MTEKVNEEVSTDASDSEDVIPSKTSPAKKSPSKVLVQCLSLLRCALDVLNIIKSGLCCQFLAEWHFYII